KQRFSFSEEQVTAMEQQFQKSPYLSRTPRLMLSSTLNIPEVQIKNWFQNRRMKGKKEGTL
ncbi:hypothetical protein HELRODRAFT_85620, partial [Helobdella robusta]|uniref:Homeobox domain-containing protein n=1 Tax=Helobdella robusta TaxID=6412 RepID=T1G607_HELRO